MKANKPDLSGFKSQSANLGIQQRVWESDFEGQQDLITELP